MKQIIAIGSLTAPEENALLFQYILDSCQKERPRICFVTTAQGDNSDSLLLLYSAFAKLECQPSHLSLLFPETADLHNLVFDKDIILVAGGNAKKYAGALARMGIG
jgi:peptidase E